MAKETKYIAPAKVTIHTPTFNGMGCLRLIDGHWEVACVTGEVIIYGEDQDGRAVEHFRTNSTSFVRIPKVIQHD